MLPSTLDMVPSPSTLDKKIDSAPVMRTLERYLFFSLLKTIELSNYIMISFRTGPPTENYCLHSQVISSTFEKVLRLIKNLARGKETCRIVRSFYN